LKLAAARDGARGPVAHVRVPQHAGRQSLPASLGCR